MAVAELKVLSLEAGEVTSPEPAELIFWSLDGIGYIPFLPLLLRNHWVSICRKVLVALCLRWSSLENRSEMDICR